MRLACAGMALVVAGCAQPQPSAELLAQAHKADFETFCLQPPSAEEAASALSAAGWRESTPPPLGRRQFLQTKREQLGADVANLISQADGVQCVMTDLEGTEASHRALLEFVRAKYGAAIDDSAWFMGSNSCTRFKADAADFLVCGAQDVHRFDVSLVATLPTRH